METSVNRAIKKGLFKQVRYLIEFGVNVNERDESGRTPLINLAFVADNSWAVGLARNLLEKNASIRMADVRGMNAFHYACLFKKLCLIEIYLKAQDFDVNQADKQGNTALHYAACIGDRSLLMILVNNMNKYSLNMNRPNLEGCTPVSQALKYENFESANFLLERGASESVIESKDKSVPEWKKVYVDSRSVDRSSVVKENYKKREMENVHKNNIKSARQDHYSSRRIKSAPGTRRNDTVEQEAISALEYLKDKRIENAGSSALRNNPYKVFELTGIKGDQDLPFKLQPHRIQSARTSISSSWRSNYRKLLTGFDYQFSRSYVAFVKYPEEDWNLDEEGIRNFASRRPSATPNQILAEPVIRKKGKDLRRKSVVLKVEAITSFQEKIDRNNEKRKSIKNSKEDSSETSSDKRNSAGKSKNVEASPRARKVSMESNEKLNPIAE
ncbi:unnamed protein product [Dimorphilus gyrociliatus]|uniref:Uncharacterized protein n=1 Tax=Dimorphilus gyrociliatus TaxID=2664684 RepID=A0A7I8V669_9ANNE|nr:unnamed protein product [Dimorphilus gyrociliatus]